MEGKFVIKNVINLSIRNLSVSESSLLSKEEFEGCARGYKIVPAELKTESEEYGRNRRLMWHFRNDERSFVVDIIKTNTSFNPRSKDIIIDTYLSYLEGRLLDIGIFSKRLNNLTNEEQEALYSAKDEPSIIFKGADKGPSVVLWDRNDYFKDAYRQINDKEVHWQVLEDPRVFAYALKKALEKTGLREICKRKLLIAF